MTLPPLPTFADFFREVHRAPDGSTRDPFPWQSRLAEHVAEAGWPPELGIPTGLGKTSAIDVAVWSLAAQAERPPAQRTAPTRIWYLVDRRLLVDAASDHVTQLAGALERAYADPGAAPALRSVACRLAAIGAVGRPQPLFASRMRGGAAPGLRPPDPATPAVICSTVAMYGSSLLFRSFTSSDRMWPIDAALAGTDTLVLLDEAHLSVPLQRLLASLPLCDTNRCGVLRVPGTFEPTAGPASVLPSERAYPQLVTLTATGSAQHPFELGADDYAHPVVHQRLHAPKPTELVPTTEKKLASTLASEVKDRLASLGRPGAGVVFVNRPATARAVQRELTGIDADVVVLTGQLRDPEADRIRAFLLSGATGCPAGVEVERSRPLVVVATQTLEVGADLDFDVCVSETAGVRALIQRWGRMNRLGKKRATDVSAALCHPEGAKESPLYGPEPAEVWQRLFEKSQEENGPLDLQPSGIAALLGDPADDGTDSPELLPVHLWEFAKTSCPPPGAAPPEVFFAGFDDEQARVSVVWRAVVPAPGGRLEPTLSSREVLDVPLWEVRDFLGKCTSAVRVSLDGATVEAVSAGELRSGDRVIVPCESGGYGGAGWDPDSSEPVKDLSPFERGVLHVSSDAIVNCFGIEVDDELGALIAAFEPDPEDGPDEEADAAAARALVEYLSAASSEVAAELWGQDPRIVRSERLDDGAATVLTWERPGRLRPFLPVDALDELSIAPSVSLHEHLASVGELAGKLAESIGVPPELVEAVVAAAGFHDLGKADRRFQRWLGNHDVAQPVAKSAMHRSEWERARKAANWPNGGRHELLSVQLLDAAETAGLPLVQPDLVRHLVLAHHGQGRPTCATTADGVALTTRIELGGHELEAITDTRIADWCQPDRFASLCERYGLWGLALLETVVRQADHLVSRATEVQ